MGYLCSHRRVIKSFHIMEIPRRYLCRLLSNSSHRRKGHNDGIFVMTKCLVPTSSSGTPMNSKVDTLAIPTCMEAETQLLAHLCFNTQLECMYFFCMSGRSYSSRRTVGPASVAVTQNILCDESCSVLANSATMQR